jgi:hypothetical protein
MLLHFTRCTWKVHNPCHVNLSTIEVNQTYCALNRNFRLLTKSITDTNQGTYTLFPFLLHI